MSVLGSIARRSLENPSYPLTSETLAEWLSGGSSLAGVPVTEGRAMGLTAYLRGISLIAGTNGALPLKVYRNGTRERVTQRTVLDSPNRAQTKFEFWQTIYANALGWGTGYARKVRNGADIVTELWAIHPAMVRVEPVDITGANPEGKLFIIRDRKGIEHRLTAWDVFHLPYLSLDGVTGLPPLRAARTALGVAIAAEDTAARFYGKGTRLGGILQAKKKLNPESAKRLKEQWRAKNAGPENAGDIAVLDDEVEFKATALPPQDAELLASRKFSVSEVARLFGIPPHMLGDVEKSTSWGSGIEQQTIGFVVYTLRPWLTLVEQRVTQELLPGGWTSGSWYAEYALEGLLRGDSKARAEFYRALISTGVMTPAMAQGLENIEPDPDLDFYMVPSNMTMIRPGGELVPLAAKGVKQSPPGGTDAPTPT